MRHEEGDQEVVRQRRHDGGGERHLECNECTAADRVIRRSFANPTMMVEGNVTGNATSASLRIDLEKLPSFDFREKEVGSSPASCAICLSNFKAGYKSRLLPICKHSFHMEYVDEWLLVKAHYPICCGSANSIEMVENTVGLGGHQNDRRSSESCPHRVAQSVYPRY